MSDELDRDEAEDGGITFSQVIEVHARAVTGADDAELLGMARRRALDPTIFDEFPPYIFGGEISSTRWDSYYTRMAPSTLRNYADDVTDGVSFLRNHDIYSDPIGHSLVGKFVNGGGNGVARALADFYVLTDPDTAPYVAKIKAGVVRYLSVGFMGGQWICSICGKDMEQWFTRDGCPHILGFPYTPRDEAGEQVGEPVIAMATIENARLREVSGVYKGATPGAMIQKARAMAAEGLLSDRERDLVQVRYRMQLPAAARAFPAATIEKEVGEMPENDRGNTPPNPPQSDALRAVLTELGAPEGADANWLVGEIQASRAAVQSVRAALTDAGVAEGVDIPTAIRDLGAEVARLRPLADDGRAYRADLIEETLAEGVRAQGERFPAETYRALLERAGLDHIKQVRDTLKEAGDKRLPGGRQTIDSHDPPEATPRKKRPATVYG